MHFYKPNKGTILLNGTDIQKYRLKELRGEIGIIGQNIFMWNNLIMENLRYVNPTASGQQIYEATRIAQIHELINSQRI